MTEQEAIAKIHSVYPTGKKNGIENMRALMAHLGNCQSTLRMIHVAGTNGKGSCCAMLERMLRDAGYKTGLYTSPYIQRYNERIRLNGKPIDGEKLASLVERVFPAVEACVAEGVQVTEFEVGTALAFCAFAWEHVDVAIIEVGLGGRIDPTNIITPAVSVITEVGMDHMAYLGNTIEEIALEKAGIMKPGVPVSLGHQEKAALSVLRAAAKGLSCPVYEVRAEQIRETDMGVLMNASVDGDMNSDLFVALAGRHQADNACAALGAIAALRRQGWKIPAEAVRSGLRSVRWPGRLERFGNVLLDGAHNEPGVRALCAYCDKWLHVPRTVLLTGMMRDKDTEKMTAMLATRVFRVVTTEPNLPRSMSMVDLCTQFRKYGARAVAVEGAEAALAFARSLAGRDGTVLVAGSLYLIGEVRAILEEEEDHGI